MIYTVITLLLYIITGDLLYSLFYRYVNSIQHLTLIFPFTFLFLIHTYIYLNSTCSPFKTKKRN